MKKILFYIEQAYYWESLQPIYGVYAQDDDAELYLYIGKNQKRFLKLFLISNKSKIEKRFRNEGFRITDLLDGYDVVFAGAQLRKPSRFGQAILCNVDHGPGIKTLRYRHLLRQKGVKYHCFVEGQYRLDKFKKYGLDKIHAVYTTGLPKLDRFFDGSLNREAIMQEFGLNPRRKTVLYAPSYKPTSIFLIGDQIPELRHRYNLVVKLHPYSWGGKYASHAHHRYFESMVKKYPEIQLVAPENTDIMPLMFVADTMISDGSSVINEFLALERCGVIIDLPEKNQTHHDGTPLLEERSAEWLQESFVHINPDDDLAGAVELSLHPSSKQLAALKRDKHYIFSHTDGKSAYRVKNIVDSLLSENLEPKILKMS